MALFSAKCTTCGANVDVDSFKDTALCDYCGTEFFIEKNTPSTISASVVNVYKNEGAPVDFIVVAGTLSKYNGSSPNVVIPEGVITIGNTAFSGCTGITSIIMSDTVRHIGNWSFGGCSELERVKLSSKLTSIGPWAFSGCRNLTEITLPETLRDIKSSAFNDCVKLTSIKIPEGVTTINTGAFNRCHSLINIEIPMSVLSIEKEAFAHCYNLENLSLPSSLVSIGDSAFEGCAKLHNLSVPQGVISIGSEAFSNCIALDHVTLPQSLVELSSDAFQGCFNLMEISHPPQFDWKDFKGTAYHKALDNTNMPKIKEKMGCYIATAVYGSYNCPELWVLRRFRDNVLAKSIIGRAFIKIYYGLSPLLISLVGDKQFFTSTAKHCLDWFTSILENKGFSSKPYNDPR